MYPNLVLRRQSFNEWGILSTLEAPLGIVLFHTLEHAYLQDDGSYKPKLNYGIHACVQGTHQLSHGGPILAYEITQVPGHTGILFHVGNTNEDSDGCVLLGLETTNRAVSQSREAFEKFMAMQEGKAFTLVVI